MNREGTFEKKFVTILSTLFAGLSVKGSYRVASSLYSYTPNDCQVGVWMARTYLNPKYNLKIHLFSKDLIDHKILFTGVYEKETNWVLEKHIQAGDVVLEAGANSGTETLLISRLVGNDGTVHAFEPVPHVASKLQRNLELNAIENVAVNRLALGESMKEITFFILPETHPNQGMGSKVVQNAAGTEINVQQVTLDSLNLDRLDFLKMDVQGAERDILKGARETIRELRPKIFLEAGEGWSSIEELYGILHDFRYQVNRISPRLELIPIDNNALEPGNWLALPKFN